MTGPSRRPVPVDLLVHGGDVRTVDGAGTAVRMATIEGARTLGLDDAPGSPEAGRRADPVVLDLGGPHLAPAHDPWSTLAYAARTGDVRDTLVDGRVLMRDRALTTLDEGAALTEPAALVSRSGLVRASRPCPVRASRSCPV